MGVVSCVVTVSVAVELPPETRATDVGDNEIPGPLGEMLGKRLIVPANPPVLVSVIVDDPEPPRMICSVEGLAVTVKSGGAG